MAHRCGPSTSGLTLLPTPRQGPLRWSEFPERAGQNFRNPHSAFGARCSVLGTRYSVFGARRSAFGVRRSAFGIRRSAFGARRSVLGARRSAFGARPSSSPSSTKHRASALALQQSTSSQEMPNIAILAYPALRSGQQTKTLRRSEHSSIRAVGGGTRPVSCAHDGPEPASARRSRAEPPSTGRPRDHTNPRSSARSSSA